MKATQAQLATMRKKAWKAAEQAMYALAEYASTAEDYEQPTMSFNAVDAADLAPKISEYYHRFEVKG